MKDERLTPAVPLWSRQWTSRCRRPRKLFYIDFLLNFSRHYLPSASRRRKMLPCTEEEVAALFYFISNLYLTLYPIWTLSIPFPNFTAVHGVGVAQAKPARKHDCNAKVLSIQYTTCTIYTTHWPFHIYVNIIINKTIDIKKIYIYLLLNFTQRFIAQH